MKEKGTDNIVHEMTVVHGTNTYELEHDEM
jgi:hypothetical protein